MTTTITVVMMSTTAAASAEAHGTMTLENETMAQPDIGSLSDALLTSATDAHNGTIAGARPEPHRAGGVWRPDRTSPDGPIDALATLNGRLVALKARNRELEREVRQLRAELRHPQSRPATPLVQPITASGPTRARRTPAEKAERRRLERDLHDSVQNELVALLLKLTLIEEDHETPPALAGMLASVGANAAAALDSVREITLGVPPLLLARFGVLDARGLARIHAGLNAKAPR
jgi:signal transduction histidine kinase